MDLQSLKNEIVNDPANLGYKNSDGTWKSNDEIMALILNPQFPEIRSLASSNLLKWTAQYDAIGRLQTAIAGMSAGELRGIANVALELTSPSSAVPIDFSDASVKAMFDALVQAGIFTQSEEDALISLATFQISRADVLQWYITEDISKNLDGARAI